MFFVLAALSSAVVTPTQTTHVVGPGALPQINAALAVAAPGDVVLVMPGTYEPFTVTGPVTIRAAAPGTVLVNVASGGPSVLWSSTVTLASSQAVHLVDLTIRVLSISGGTTTLDGCTVTGYQFWGLTAVTVQAGTVHLQGCALNGSVGSFGGGAGLVAGNATVTAIDSTFAGANVGSPLDGPGAGVAISLQGSQFHGSRVTGQGGAGGAFAYPPRAALQATNSTVWISDSTLTGGTAPGGIQACPLLATSGRFERCTLVPASPCSVGIPGGPLLAVHRVAPMHSPGLLALEFQTDANGFVAVYVSTALGRLMLPGLEQPIFLDPANVFPLAFLLADPVGHAAGSWNIPAGLVDATFWFQGVSGPTFPLQLSPVVGGVVR
ncbi:MAG: hypothetical protein KF830_18960 [Planctomycetes bacterium]|nr:hypothetical protein [Planctomycetota bacterium]